MSNTREPASPAQEISRYWLGAVRIFTIISVLFYVLSLFYLVSRLAIGEGEFEFIVNAPASFLNVVVLGLYVMVLLGVRGTPRRSALRLAYIIALFGIVTAALVFVNGFFLSGFSENAKAGLVAGVVGSFGLTQLAVIVSASGTLSSMGRAIGQKNRRT